MKLTPIDIAHKTFPKKMMGYDIDQVHEFLQQVSEAFEELVHERNSLREAVREKELSLLEHREREHVLKNTLTTASQMAEKMKQESEREAKLIIADAQSKSDELARDAREGLKKIYNDISELKRMRMQFEANLKAMAQSHLTLLEQGEKYMPQAALPNMSMAEPKKTSEVSPLSAGR